MSDFYRPFILGAIAFVLISIANYFPLSWVYDVLLYAGLFFIGLSVFDILLRVYATIKRRYDKRN